jgi:hypothetical protein
LILVHAEKIENGRSRGRFLSGVSSCLRCLPAAIAAGLEDAEGFAACISLRPEAVPVSSLHRLVPKNEVTQTLDVGTEHHRDAAVHDASGDCRGPVSEISERLGGRYVGRTGFTIVQPDDHHGDIFSERVEGVRFFAVLTWDCCAQKRRGFADACREDPELHDQIVLGPRAAHGARQETVSEHGKGVR